MHSSILADFTFGSQRISRNASLRTAVSVARVLTFNISNFSPIHVYTERNKGEWTTQHNSLIHFTGNGQHSSTSLIAKSWRSGIVHGVQLPHGKLTVHSKPQHPSETWRVLCQAMQISTRWNHRSPISHTKYCLPQSVIPSKPRT